MQELDIDRYFDRIGYDGPRSASIDTLRALHLAHPAAIPFESLDPFFGRPVQIDLASIADKLVRRKRGGYCFEQNALFRAVLEALGVRVTPLAARVRWMLPEDAPRTQLSHMLLIAHLGDRDYLCDVGFGGQSPTAPLAFTPDLEQRTPHGTYRLRRSERDFALEMRLPDRWAAMYRFTLEPQGSRDYEVYNWFTATHPASIFVNNLVAARVRGDHRVTVRNREHGVRRADGSDETARLESPTELHRVLTEDFGLEARLEDIERAWPRLG